MDDDRPIGSAKPKNQPEPAAKEHKKMSPQSPTAGSRGSPSRSLRRRRSGERVAWRWPGGVM